MISMGRKRNLSEVVCASNSVADRVVGGCQGPSNFLPTTTDAKRSSCRLFFKSAVGGFIVGLYALFLSAVCLLLLAVPAQADFGLKEVDVYFSDEDGSPVTQAGSHPFAMSTSLAVNTKVDGEGKEVPDGAIKDLEFDCPVGFVGDFKASPQCSGADFLIFGEEF